MLDSGLCALRFHSPSPSPGHDDRLLPSCLPPLLLLLPSVSARLTITTQRGSYVSHTSTTELPTELRLKPALQKFRRAPAALAASASAGPPLGSQPFPF